MGRRRPVVAAALALAAVCWLPGRGAAAPEDVPTSCRVGAFLEAIHGLDVADGTFQADFWLWSICPDADRNPLATMEFVNADEVETRLDTGEQRSEGYWRTRKVRGTFRHDWDIRNYPFDRHDLAIVLEDGYDDASSFVYDPDTRDTTYAAGMEIPGWRITSFAFVPSTATYDTTFGDPSLPAGGSSRYSRLTIDVGIARDDLSGFFRLTAAAYAAFVFVLISFFMHLENIRALSPQMSLLSAALFAVALNLVTAGSSLGEAGGLSLIDAIHISVLVTILVATLFAVFSRLRVERGWEQEAIARINHRACAATAVAFVAVNAALLLYAARVG